MTPSIRRRVLHTVFLALASSTISACMTWRVQPQLTDVRSDATVRVTRLDGSAVKISGAILRGDSVIGTSLGTRRGATPISVAVPVSDVKHMAVLRLSKGRSVASGLALATTVFIFWARSMSKDDEWR